MTSIFRAMTDSNTGSAIELRVAVVGAGMAGSRCAAALREQGHQVTLFDKSRGVGGRLSTRRTDWQDAEGRTRTLAFDHGAPAFSASHPDFLAWCQQAQAQGWLQPWSPRLAPGSRPCPPTQWVATPDMPELCRRQLVGIPVLASQAVCAVARSGESWQLTLGDGTLATGFDALVLAVPAAQAADLLQEHRPDWAAQALALPMQPCWTVMALSKTAPPLAWDAAAPTDGSLHWAAVNHLKPGRMPVTGGSTWVVQATTAWSESHLEAQQAEVIAALLPALEKLPGAGGQHWLWATAHRWRYALPRQSPTDTAPMSAQAMAPWWDPRLGLGVCGDWRGGTGVEGAWWSGQTMARALQAAPPVQWAAVAGARTDSAVAARA
jgi:hypothetical protein